MAKKDKVSKERTNSVNDSKNGSGEPSFEDPDGFVDDIKDEDLLGDILRQKPTENDDLDSIIVVDGVPQVEPDRLPKLKMVISKIFSRFGTINSEFYPTDEGSQKTKGYVFIEYGNETHAKEAVKASNGYKLDKSHVLQCNLLSDFDKYSNVPAKWDAPQPKPYEPVGDLKFYLQEADCCDQYTVSYIEGEGPATRNVTCIYLNTMPEQTLLEERSKWTETYVQWSPLGTYLATCHELGVALWGGVKFKQIMRFSHYGVQYISFSPKEKYLVTFSPLVTQKSGDEVLPIIIWDVRTGQKKRSFSATKGPAVWPVFKWSQDDQYFGRVGEDQLSIYETPSFGLLDKKSIKTDRIKDFSWSPSDNTLAYWVSEEKEIPARVVLIEVPSRQEIRVKNLFSVANCKMHWQQTGDYLCVKVDRYQKVRKEKSNEVKYAGVYCNFEIFHMREKQIPVDSVEIKESIQAFAWEPVGSKFAVIHGDPPNISVSFYDVKLGHTPEMLKKFERKPCNHLFWSPKGQYIVLAGLRNRTSSMDFSGTLDFIDTNDFTIMNNQQGEHLMATNIEWDPTGRYVTSGVSFWEAKTVDHSYWIWSFQGRVLQRYPRSNFCQFLWRPRPASLLTEKQVKDIKKNLKKYSSQFEVKDKMKSTKESKELLDKRRKLVLQFEEYRKSRIHDWEEQKKRRLQLRDNIDTDEVGNDEKNMEEERIEFFVKEETTVLDE